MRCLWIAADVPHPATFGKLVYSAGLSESLARQHVEVVGLGLARPDAPPPERTAVSWQAVRAMRRGRAGSLRTTLPSMTYATTPLRGALESRLRDGPWDAVFVEHLETGWVVDAIPESGPPIVFVSQNHEASVRREVARNARGNPAHRAAMWLEAIKARRLERHVVERACVIIAITEADASRFTEDDPHSNVLVLPPGYAGPMREHRAITPDTPRRVTIVTSLDWHVKQANLETFVAAADPIFSAAGIELAVAGSAPREFADHIATMSTATRMLGRVEALDELLAGTRVGIVAEPLGGGFKIKALDYVFNRVPLVSVAGSIEGMPLRRGVDHLVFDDAVSLARGVVDIIDDTAQLNMLQNSAFERSRAAFDWNARGIDLAEALRNIVARSNQERA